MGFQSMPCTSHVSALPVHYGKGMAIEWNRVPSPKEMAHYGHLFMQHTESFVKKQTQTF